MIEDLQKFREILQHKARYSLEAYHFVLHALHFLIRQFDKPRHVSGRELLDAVRNYGFEKYGFLAPLVFGSWGVKETVDFGQIVFDLVELEVLKKRESDSLDDFKDVYEFGPAFRQNFISSLEKF